MGLFSRKPDASKPRKGWPWRLTIGDAAPRQDFSYADVKTALEKLIPDGDSFVILEQRDPKDARHYWYIQSAIALAGSERGRYIIGVGYPREGAAAYMERYTMDLKEVLRDFDLAYRCQGPDLSYYVDCSRQPPVK